MDCMSNENLPSAFKSSKYQIEVGEQRIILRVLKMDGSTLIFICNQAAECIDEMAVGMQMMNSDEVLATTIMGQHVISDSQRLAEKLARRYRRQFIISLNVPVDRMEGPLLERKLIECIKKHENAFV